MTSKIVLASGNAGKLSELQNALSDFSVQLIPQTELDIESVEETGLTFMENAILKARHASKVSGLPALSDDSGIEVDYLKGAPGIYSARYAGEAASDADNNAKLLAALEGVPVQQRSARFHCVLVYMRHWQDPTPLVCLGQWEGQIQTSLTGEAGFGYDPLFYVPALQKCAAQLTKQEKNQVSHRGQAIAQLKRGFRL